MANLDVETYMSCQKCLLAAAGMTSHETGEDLSTALSKIEQGPNVTVTTGDSYNDVAFSTAPCETCDETLAGSRHEVLTLTDTES